MNKGAFIVLEGVEGVGKTTQCKMLAQALNDRGIETIITREPGGDKLSEKIRELLKSTDYSMSALTELYLFQAARKEHLDSVVFPALEQGKVVICDRFVYSTIAYQGYGRHIPIEFIKQMNLLTIAPLVMDLTLFLDLSPEKAFKRKNGADKDDRIEQAGKEFFTDVYTGFIAQVNNKELQLIDADRSIEEIHNDILTRVEDVLRSKKILR